MTMFRAGRFVWDDVAECAPIVCPACGWTAWLDEWDVGGVTDAEVESGLLLCNGCNGLTKPTDVVGVEVTRVEFEP
jgi:hypothetical protein